MLLGISIFKLPEQEATVFKTQRHFIIQKLINSDQKLFRNCQRHLHFDFIRNCRKVHTQILAQLLCFLYYMINSSTLISFSLSFFFKFFEKCFSTNNFLEFPIVTVALQKLFKKVWELDLKQKTKRLKIESFQNSRVSFQHSKDSSG